MAKWISLPGLTIDRYADDVVVLQTLTPAMEALADGLSSWRSGSP